jgi:hypothetical protein
VSVFSLPDYTVGIGFSPIQFRYFEELAGFPNLSGFTAGLELPFIIARLTMPRRLY